MNKLCMSMKLVDALPTTESWPRGKEARPWGLGGVILVVLKKLSGGEKPSLNSRTLHVTSTVCPESGPQSLKGLHRVHLKKL